MIFGGSPGPSKTWFSCGRYCKSAKIKVFSSRDAPRAIGDDLGIILVTFLMIWGHLGFIFESCGAHFGNIWGHLESFGDKWGSLVAIWDKLGVARGH